MEIYQLLRNERLKSGKTQAKFAENVFSAANYSKVERGQQEINARNLLQILM